MIISYEAFLIDEIKRLANSVREAVEEGIRLEEEYQLNRLRTEHHYLYGDSV